MGNTTVGGYAGIVRHKDRPRHFIRARLRIINQTSRTDLGPMDKLRALKFFCRVAETKSFAAAAYELDVVPSVLSKQIAALETDVHFKLFNRTTRRVSLTEHGARYYDHCKRLLIELDEAELLERGGMAKAAGKIVAGMHPAINRVLMSRIDEFLTAYPDIIVETTITSTPATMLDDKLDLWSRLPTFRIRVSGSERSEPRATSSRRRRGIFRKMAFREPLTISGSMPSSYRAGPTGHPMHAGR